jgi:hypothetical protein
MKRGCYLFVVLIGMVGLSQSCVAELYLLDTIKVVVFGEERTDIITHSDLVRPSLDGSNRSLEDHVLESLVFQDAVRFKIMPTPESIEKHLMAVQRENNLSLEDLQAIFRNAGYTYEEGKEKFGIISAVGQMLDFKIRSRLIVPEKDVVAYYEANPEYTPETYQLVRAFVNCGEDQEVDALRAEVEQLIDTGSSSLEIQWSESFWIKSDDLAENRQFVRTMQVGGIAIAQEFDEGLELIKVMDHQEKGLVPLEKRYGEIAEILRRPKYEELFGQYKKELFDGAAIIYFD